MSHPLLDPRGTPRVMGVLNVTPDSFSDGGRWADVDAALAHGRRLAADGADLVDVGGESTRPGARRPDVAEELDRVLPVVTGLVADGVVVSVDTMRAEVAAAAVAAGARVVNDVSGGLADPAVLDVVADAAGTGLVYVAMHWRAHSHEMTGFASYDGPGGVVAGVVAELGDRLAAAVAAGVSEDRVVLDPGLGFAKTGDHNWSLLAALPALEALGRPLLVGASRKSFLGSLLADTTTEPPTPRDVGEREAANVAVSTLAACAGVWGLRVHDVRASQDAVAVVRRWREAGGDRA